MQLCEDSPFPVPCLPTWRGFSCIHNFYVPGEPNNDWYTSIEHEDSLNTSVAFFRSVAWSHDWHEAHRLRKIRSLSPFDDGRRNFHEFFFPLLKEFQVESTEAMMTAVDLLGFHVRLKTRMACVVLASPSLKVRNAAETRKVLVEMVQQARRPNELAHSWHTGPAIFPAKSQFSTDWQSLYPCRRATLQMSCERWPVRKASLRL